MGEGYFCAAGINEKNQHVRPVKKGLMGGAERRLSIKLLEEHGGVFQIANIVDIARSRPHSSPPHTEDYVCNPKRLKLLGRLTEKEFWNTLNTLADTKLINIFGEQLEQIGSSSCGTKESRGEASLGCFIPAKPIQLYLKPGYNGKPEKIRMKLEDKDFKLDLGVTEIRLYKSDHISPDKTKIKEIANRIRKSRQLILSLGLTRPFQPVPTRAPVNWLQVNNIYMRENPLW